VYLLHNLPITRGLYALLTSIKILKVGFGMSTDQLILQRRMNAPLRPVLDMQLLVIPYTDTDHVWSLGIASQKFTGLVKPADNFAGQQDWTTPLDKKRDSDQRVSYAVLDVRMISALYKHFNPHLELSGPTLYNPQTVDSVLGETMCAQIRGCKKTVTAVAYVLNSGLVTERCSDDSMAARKCALGPMNWL